MNRNTTKLFQLESSSSILSFESATPNSSASAVNKNSKIHPECIHVFNLHHQHYSLRLHWLLGSCLTCLAVCAGIFHTIAMTFQNAHSERLRNTLPLYFKNNLNSIIMFEALHDLSCGHFSTPTLLFYCSHLFPNMPRIPLFKALVLLFTLPAVFSPQLFTWTLIFSPSGLHPKCHLILFWLPILKQHHPPPFPAPPITMSLFYLTIFTRCLPETEFILLIYLIIACHPPDPHTLFWL